MEKLTIKPWQVMQAHENGANLEMSLIGSDKWSNFADILWNWHMRNYRIADLTADGMRLDELVEKYCAKDDCNLDNDLITKDKKCLFSKISNNYRTLLVFLIEHPECISQVKVKQDKKLRPWTIEEFEEYRDEWFVSKGNRERIKVNAYDPIGVTFCRNMSLTYREIMNNIDREDGSPCGVLE